MSTAELVSIAMLIRERIAIDARIADLIGGPVESDRLAEWVAAEVFDIELEGPGSRTPYDGRFRSGPYAGRTVDVKYHARHHGLLDMSDTEDLDCYLVLTGPRGAVPGSVRPWCIDHVFLFDAQALIDASYEQMRRIGPATGVRAEHWQAAEIHPNRDGRVPVLTPDQTKALNAFRSDALASP